MGTGQKTNKQTNLTKIKTLRSRYHHQHNNHHHHYRHPHHLKRVTLHQCLPAQGVVRAVGGGRWGGREWETERKGRFFTMWNT